MSAGLNAGDYLEFEKIVLGMVLADPSILGCLSADLFDSPWYRSVLEAMQRLSARGERLTVNMIRKEAGENANCVPEPWFTIANLDFYIRALEGRRQRRDRKAQLLDELRTMDREGG